MRTRIFTLLLALIASVPILASQSGTCGTNLTWVLTDDGTLTISGTGAMTDYVDPTSSSGTKSPFKTATIKTIILEDGVTSVGNYAFYMHKEITSISFPESLISIGKDAFYKCTGLTSIAIPGNNANSIGDLAFMECSNLTSVSLPNSITSIGRGAFRETGLVSVTLPENLTSVSQLLFQSCSKLTEVIIGNKTQSIGSSAFNDCGKLSSITIGSGVTSIEGAFYNSPNLKTVHISDIEAWCKITFSTSNNYANPMCYGSKLYLNGEELVNLVIPEGITKIKTFAFNGCKSITTVTIPESVTSIGEYAFWNCTYLMDFYVPWSDPITINENTFKNVDLSLLQLHVPCRRVAYYQRAAVWKNCNPIVEKCYSVVTWYNYDNSVLYQNDEEIGSVPEYVGAPPTKPATQEYTYTFAGWTPEIVPVSGEATYTAVFDSTKIVYDVNITIPDTIEAHGTVIIEGEPTYGDTITITAEPADGWYFVEWSDGETENPREIVIEGDTAIYPIFAQCEEIIVNLTKTIYNGQEYVFGEQTLTQKGTYTDTLTLANGCDSVVVLKLNVVNSRIKYNLSVVVNDESMGSVTGTGVFKAGTEVTITATPVSNKYIFVRWYNEDENIDVYENPYTFTLTRNLQLRAVFKKAPRREPERESQPGFTKGNKKNINK